MKLLVFSDSHGHIAPVLAAAAEQNDITACFFLGDGQNDADAFRSAFPKIPLYEVRGNCDFVTFAPPEGLVPCAGKLIFYTHGHLYNVKTGLSRLCDAASAVGADIAFYGHTHIVHLEKCGGIWLFNPGAVFSPRKNGPTCGLVAINGDDISFEYIKLSAW